MSTRDIERAAECLAAADALLISAGAGMGVDSGLPDFRGSEGFWKAYPPYERLGLHFQQLANPANFARDPELAWGFYGHRHALYGRTQPHAGFGILRAWAERLSGGWFVFTSNVDGHFQKAGFAEARVYECHGSIRHLQCQGPCSGEIVEAAAADLVTVDEETMRAVGELPACPRCGEVARPNILMFGDGDWVASRAHAQERRYAAWLGTLEGRTVAVVECGAGSAIPTVRYESERVAADLGGTLIRINVREPETPAGHIGIALPALEALRAIEARQH